MGCLWVELDEFLHHSICLPDWKRDGVHECCKGLATLLDYTLCVAPKQVLSREVRGPDLECVEVFTKRRKLAVTPALLPSVRLALPVHAHQSPDSMPPAAVEEVGKLLDL